MKKIALIGMVAALFWAVVGAAVAQNRSDPKGDVTTELPSGVKYGRQSWADSTLNGGRSHNLPDGGTSIALPDPCAFDPKRCEEPTTGGGGSGVVVTPPVTPSNPGEDLEWCGMPADYVLNADPNCAKVQGGWRCRRNGGTYINYVCP